MLKSGRFTFIIFSILFVFSVLGAMSQWAQAQDFTMQIESALNPPSLLPSDSAVATISLTPASGFTGSVSLSCAVTPVQTTGTPVCNVSPTSTTPPSSPSITITTSGTPTGSYVATITATGGTTTQQLPLTFAVLTVTPGYTLTVTGPITPSSVHAGNGATATITITPANGYTGSVTLSCSAITPSVTPAPSCAFNPTPVVISATTAETSTLTISTTPNQASLIHPRIFYALWLPLPAFAWMAIGLRPGRKLRRRFLSMILLCCLALGLVFLPACGYKSSSSTSNGNGTPKNTYTFTLSGSDTNSVAPTNGTQTVTLTVD